MSTIHRLAPDTRRALLDWLCRWNTGCTNVHVKHSPTRSSDMERVVTGVLVGVARTPTGQEFLMVQDYEYESGTLGALTGIPVATVVNVTTGETPYEPVADLLAQARLA